MNDTDLSPLEPDVQAVIDGASGIEPATASARIRIRDRIEGAIGGSGVGGDGGGSLSTVRPSVAAPSSLRLSTVSMRAAAPLVVSFVLGAMTSAGVLVALGVSRSSHQPEAAPAAAMGVSPGAAEPMQSASEVSVEPAPLPAMAGEPAPVASEQVLVRTGPRAEALTPRSQLALERRLLDKARAALERGEPVAALADVARHERQFPSGALGQEREAMAIRALVALGRGPEARARAARFRATYPTSVLLSTVDEMVEEPASR